MIKLLNILNRQKWFVPEILKETTKQLKNPYRGWFELHIHHIEEESITDKSKIINSEDTLVLLLMDIGICRDRNLEDSEICKIEEIIDFYYNIGKKIILRVTYDALGKGMQREPASFNQVIAHAEQIAGFLKQQKQKIFIYQGLLVGRWGEMHTTKYASPEKLRELNIIFEEQIGKTLFRVVRKPVQWRMLCPKQDFDNDLSSNRLGIFDDGMFGSESDLGTFASDKKNQFSWNESWDREKEIEMISMIAERVPFGGEALLGEGYSVTHSYDDYLSELKKMKVTYLNKHHDKNMIERWKREIFKSRDVWNGYTVLEYIGAHLGYRFFIREVDILKEHYGFNIKITIENKGFANLYKDTELILQIEDGFDEIKVVFTDKLNACLTGNSMIFNAKIGNISGACYVWARVTTENNAVYFANENADEKGRIFIGELKKS